MSGMNGSHGSSPTIGCGWNGGDCGWWWLIAMSIGGWWLVGIGWWWAAIGTRIGYRGTVEKGCRIDGCCSGSHGSIIVTTIVIGGSVSVGGGGRSSKKRRCRSLWRIHNGRIDTLFLLLLLFFFRDGFKNKVSIV